MSEAAPPPLPPAEWYYADANDQRQGPVSEAALMAMLGDGTLRRETLVWRQGMDGWRSLQQAFALPPPDLATMQFRSGVPSGVEPKRKGMSGCLIAALVLAVVSVPMIGILAAIALPAYQDYTMRSKVMQVEVQTAALRGEIEARRTDPDAPCPQASDLSMPAAMPGVASIAVTQLPSGYCGVRVELGSTGSTRLDGQQIIWEFIDTGDQPIWQCHSKLPEKYLPASCR